MANAERTIAKAAASRANAYEPVVGFASEKAAQISAFFVSQSGGKIAKMALAKLLYLAEREHLKRHSRSLMLDELYSLPHGPICSGTLNGIDGKLEGREEWARFSNNGPDEVHGKVVTRDQLDEVSDAELATIQGVWQQFGKMRPSALRGWTHNPKNCPEYVEVPKGSRLPISYVDVLRALGKPEPEQLAAEIERQRMLDLAFAES